ncbi:winged helix-turn-helix domain-containing protein [Rheinheimera sp.]|uniref:winged helix-turn-helix domain-containing protein n=1 Tax=Rheinheimera sp. TaxID=1869214 RepID=UPI0040476535
MKADVSAADAALATASRWQLSDVLFDSKLRQLQHANRIITLEPKVSSLLQCLLSSPDQFASTDTLLAQVWSGRVVSDSAVQRAVYQLRKAFAELLPNQTVVRNYNRTGYRIELMAIPLPTELNPCASLDRIVPARRRYAVSVFMLAGLVCSLSWVVYLLLNVEPLLRVAGVAQPVSSLPGVEFALSGSNSDVTLYLHRHDEQSRLILQQGDAWQVVNSALQPELAALSPDGKQLLLSQRQPDCSIGIAQLSPQATLGVLKPLVSCSNDSQPRFQWLADQTGFVYRQREDKSRPYQWYLYQFASGQHFQLTLNAQVLSSNGDLALAMSDDSQTFALARYHSVDKTEIIIAQRTTLQPSHTATLQMPVQAISWFDSNTLLLASRDQIWQYHINSGKLALLHQTAGYVNSLLVRGSSLLYGVTQQSGDIWQYDLDTNQSSRLISSSRHDALPRRSPDGSKLAFLSNRSGAYQLWLTEHDGPARLLTSLSPAAFTRISWSANSQFLYYSMQGAVYQVDVISADTRQLLDNKAQAFFVQPVDDHTLLYSSMASGDWQLWLYDISANTQRMLTTDGGYSGFVDGEMLYFTRYHQDGLWQRNIQTGHEVELIADFDRVNWLNWQLYPDAILFFRPQTAETAGGIWRYNRQTTEQSLVWTAGDDFVHHYQLNGQKLLVVKRQPASGDIYQLPLTTSGW